MKDAEVQAVKGAFITSAGYGATFFFGVAMFGVAFWYIHKAVVIVKKLFFFNLQVWQYSPCEL